MARSPYAGKWPRVRKSVLDRDGWLCQIRGPGCTATATCVDHIVPVDDGGAWWDPSNLRASCWQCNNARRGAYRARRWRSARTHITLVTGGRSAVAMLTRYVRTHAVPGDLVVDLATLTQTLGTEDAGTHAYTSLLASLSTGRCSAPRAWLTSTAPDALRLPHHTVVTLDPGGETPQRSRASLRSAPVTGGAPLTASRSW